MKFRKILYLGLLGMTSVVMASCGENNSRPVGDANEIYICVYDGGYGTGWIDTLARRYEEKTGVKVHWEADSTILDRIENQLKDGGEYDIIMSHDINWQSYAAQGYLANLDDLYQRTVEGTNIKFQDRVVDSALDLSKARGEDGNEHYYKVCYTQGAGGLVYNIDMFDENGWEVPQTYDELVALCNTITSSQIEIEGERGKYVKPFVWAGTDRQYYWDYLVFEWWAQLATLNKVDTIREYKGPDGKYSTGYEMYNPDTYYKEFVQAYEMWYNLIAVNNDPYSILNSYSSNLASAKSAFVNGHAAMIPYAQWAKYELEQVATNGTLDFDIAMMKTPKANASVEDVNYMVGFGDSMIIPENAYNKEGAKDFLAFMATDEAMTTFVEETEGAFLAFDYSDVTLTDAILNDTYSKSVYDKLTTSKNFTTASKNPITYWNTNCVMPWIGNKYYYAVAVKTPEEATPAIVGSAMYNTAKQSWAAWARNANLRD